MYTDTMNGLVDKLPMDLPDPIGPIMQLQEKLFVPVKEYPDVSISWNCVFFVEKAMNSWNFFVKFAECLPRWAETYYSRKLKRFFGCTYLFLMQYQLTLEG